MTVPGRVVLIFLDGVGIGLPDPTVNPFRQAQEIGLTPTLRNVLDGEIPTLERPLIRAEHASTFALDALLDTEGTPQSGTGQVALLTGESAAQIHGAHFGPWTPTALRPLVEERSVLKRAQAADRTVAFANAYPRGWPGPRGSRRVAGPPLAARGAGLLDRHEEALGSGLAVSSEIVNDGWTKHLGHDWLPEITSHEAGANLAQIVSTVDLTLYAHYTTDTVGHSGSMPEALVALERVDAFLGGLLATLDADTTVLVASDHGNIEDVRVGHTTNPALGLAVGPGAASAAELTDLRQVTPFVLRLLGVAE